VKAISLTITLAAFAASCGSSGPSIDFASVGNLSYAVPSGWQSRDLSDRRVTVVEWAPRDNETKESVTIMRTSPRPAVAKAGPAHVEQLLAQAQSSLPKGSFSKPSRFRTPNGFVGVRVDGDFVPVGQTQAYQRTHAVLVDGETFLHVLYTARVADRDAFEIVVNSFKHKGA
jgi:hypothetical protein